MYRVGIDIGGTSVKMGMVAASSLEKVWGKEISNPGQGYEQLCRIIHEEIVSAAGANKQKIKSVGIAIPGELDREAGVVKSAFNLDFFDVPLKAEFEKLFGGTPVKLCNDAEAAVNGEMRCGALRGKKNALMLTIGTGVGGGIVFEGRLFEGGCGRGAEPGHMLLKYGGEQCTCGAFGCVEAYCSASWVERQGERAGFRAGAKAVFDAAQAGNAKAAAIIAEFTDHLAAAIASAANLLDPEVIVIGGGVSGAGEYLFEPLQAAVNQKAFADRTYRVLPAETGNDAGWIGAALL